MTVCKATFSGTVFRGPEKRFTQNNIPISFLTLLVDGNEDLKVRVISMGKTAEIIEKELSKNDKVVMEGQLRVGSGKDEDGNDVRAMELLMSSFEKIGGSIQTNAAPKEIANFSEDDYSDDLIGEDEIPF